MKKAIWFFSIGLLSCLMSLSLVVPVSADTTMEDTTVSVDGYTEVFSVGNFDYQLTVEKNVSKVIVYDNQMKTESFITYDSDSKVLEINGDKSSAVKAISFETISTQSKHGPFKFYFDVNPSSVGDIVGAVAAVGVFASGIISGGLTWALVGNSIGKMFGINGAGDKIFSWYPGASYNGYFWYSQERASNGCRARNYNRSLRSRVGYSTPYKIYDFADGAWFYTSRECVDLY